MKLLWFAPYIVLAVVYAGDVWHSGRLARILKPALMPLAILGYSASASACSPLINLGLAFGFIGDVALELPEDKLSGKGFMVGLGAFLLGHIMYCAWLLTQAGGALNPWALLYLPAALLAGLGLFKYLKPGLKDLRGAVIAYEVAIFSMSACAFALLVSRPTASALLIWLGSVCFIASDSALAERVFIKRRVKGEFIIMSTYMAAQFLIALGAALIG